MYLLFTEQLTSLIFLILFIIVLIYLSGWFSGIETALTNLDPVQLATMRRRKEKNVEYILKLKRDMNKTLITILIGNNIVNIVLSAVTALAANAFFHSIGISIAIGIITFLIIIFGEITPKSIAIMHSSQIARKKARTLYYLMNILNPLISLFIVISGWIIRLKGEKKHHRNIIVTEENIKDLATLGQQEGLIKPLEEDIIHKVFLFGDRKVKDVMVPIKKVFTIPKGITIEEAIRKYKIRSFTRVPVMNEKKRIIGILNMKDLIGHKSGTLKSLLRKPLIVSKHVHVTTLLTMMREKKIHIAAVLDNKRRHVGIVTMEDLLEELVGEIYDEYFISKYGIRA